MCLLPCSPMAAMHDAFTRLGVMNGLSDNQVQHILQLPDGRMAITTNGNINLFDGMHFSYIHRNDSDVCSLPLYTGAYHVYVGKDDRLWVKDWKRVFCLDLRSGHYVPCPNRLLCEMGNGETVLDLFLDSEKGMWLVTKRGLRNEKSGRHIVLPPKAGTLQDLEVDADRLYLFFSTGILRCHDRTSGKLLYESAAYGIDERPLFDVTSLVVKAPDGRFYQIRVGRRSALLVFSPNSRTWRRLIDTDTLLHTLIVPDTTTAYVSCTHGIYSVHLPHGSHRLYQSIPTTDGSKVSGDINTIFQDRQQGIWVGTSNRGLYYAHPKRYLFHSASYPIPVVLQAKQKALPWIRYGGMRFNDVLIDSRGWTWCGTMDGLRLYVPESDSVRTWYTEDGLSNNFVHAIVEDRAGRIWVSTSYGISRITTDGNPDSLVIASFQKEDGTLGGEYRNGEARVLADGRIVMEGVDGWTVFHPDSVSIPIQAFRPILAGLTMNGQPIACHSLPQNERHVFTHKENNLGFRFVVPNYAWPGHTCYRYRLVHGADSTWFMASRRQNSELVDASGHLHLSYALLPSGHYRLQVQASTLSGYWDEPATEVEFEVLAPWWRTQTAYAIYAVILFLVIACSVWLYVRLTKLRIQRCHKEEILLLRIQNLIERCDSYERHAEECTTTADVPAEPPISATDSEFLNRAVALVEAHMGATAYSVEQLSKDLCMERSGLYKKLNALVDKSPSLFIRSIRLRRAADLIMEGRMSMTEIAEHVGFSSASYMGKCFQEEFGCKPSEYARKTRKST